MCPHTTALTATRFKNIANLRNCPNITIWTSVFIVVMAVVVVFIVVVFVVVVFIVIVFNVVVFIVIVFIVVVD